MKKIKIDIDSYEDYLKMREEIECKMLFTPPIVDINNPTIFCREITCLRKAVVYIGVVIVGYNRYTFILPLCEKHYEEYSSNKKT